MQPCVVTSVLETTAHASPCHGFGKSPPGSWDPKSCCCGPVQPGLRRPWGGEASNLLFCSSGVGCTRTARLLPGKGLFSLLPSSRAVTSFRNGAASRPVPCLCVLLSWQSDAHGPQPSASALTQGRGAGSWWHTVNASFCWCR